MKNLVGYVLVRTDMPSLGRGKAIAHAMHAGNQMTWREVVMPMSKGEEIDPDLMHWHRMGNGFGTAVALGEKNEINLSTISSVVRAAKNMGFIADLVVDPEYPYLVDNEIAQFIDLTIHTSDPVPGPKGFTVCFRNEVTMAYIFGEKEDLKPLLGRFNLVPND